MGQEIEDLSLKLKVKEQWYCDYCGEIIESDKDGMLEWDNFLTKEDTEFTAKNFRIVHHRSVKNCRPKHADDYLSDGHLQWYTGPNGLNELLTLANRHKLDTQKFNNIIRRLHVDYYEEGSSYLPAAREDGAYDINPYDDGDITLGQLKWLIEKYGNKKELL